MADIHSHGPRIAVFGGRVPAEHLLEVAAEVGKLIAERGGILYCGGMGGVMEAVAKGATEAGGVTVGILPTGEADSANQYIQVPVATGIGTARNSILARSVDGGIAINGRYGTLTEIAYALDYGKPVVGIETWDIEGIIHAQSARGAINKLWEAGQWK